MPRLLQQSVVGPATREIAEELKRGLKGGGGLIEFEIDYDEPVPPTALQEPADMVTVEPSCHRWQPINVVEDWTDSLHRIICGEPFSMG